MKSAREKLKSWFWDIIASGRPVDYDLDTLRKYWLFNSALLLGILFLPLLGTIAFIQHDYVLGAVDFLVFSFLVALLFLLRRAKNINYVGIVGATVIGVFYLFLIAQGGVNQTAHVWAFSYPLITFFLLGKRLGTCLSLALLSLSCVVFGLSAQIDFFTRYSPSLVFRFIAAYLTIHLLALIMEFTREQIHQRLQVSKLDLEKALNNLQTSTIQLGESNKQLYGEIDERKRIEKALRDSEGFLDDIIESIQDGIVVLDPDLTIRHTNSIVKRWYQNALPLVGKKCYFCFHGRKPPCDPCPTLRCFESGQAEREIKAVSLSSATEYLEVYSFPIIDNDSGEITGAVEFLRDITERRRLENQLAQAQKMEAVGTLAGGVAHDLNNILSGIVSYPELLLMKLPGDSPLRKNVQTIQKSGQKAAAIVQDLLTLARRGVPVFEVINLRDLVTGFLHSPECRKIMEYHPKAQITSDFDVDVSNIMGSPVHLFQTVMNLVSNATEAMVDGGTVSIAVFDQHIDRRMDGYEEIPAGDYVVLHVDDSGYGIAPDDIDRIFEPFYTKKKMGRSGTGLGMAVVWGTVKDLDGFIDVQSTEGVGTQFSLYFPVTSKVLPPKEEVIPVEAYSGKERILVVDDVPEQREIASAILKTLGYSVDVVSSGEGAIEFLKENRVQLVILDMIMDPGMDGLSTYQEIIKIYPQQKVLIASGYSETIRVKEAQRSGAGAYLKKPYTLEEIGLAVRAELGKKP